MSTIHGECFVAVIQMILPDLVFASEQPVAELFHDPNIWLVMPVLSRQMSCSFTIRVFPGACPPLPCGFTDGVRRPARSRVASGDLFEVGSWAPKKSY
jgi:hypothetical protein